VIGFSFPRLLAWETIWNLLCLMSEIYPSTSYDHITKKMINFRNVVIISAPKGVSNFAHTIIKHVHKCKWSYTCFIIIFIMVIYATLRFVLNLFASALPPFHGSDVANTICFYLLFSFSHFWITISDHKRWKTLFFFIFATSHFKNPKMQSLRFFSFLFPLWGRWLSWS